MKTLVRLPTVVLFCAFTAGCAKWGVEPYEGRTRDLIDARLMSGLPFAEFERQFPAVERLDGDTVNGRFLVTDSKVCFWCSGVGAFRRSKEFYARVVRFENSKLVAVDPVSGGASQ